MAAPEPAPAPEPFDGVEMTFVGEEDDFVPMEEHDLRPRRPSLCSCSGGVGPWARRLATFPLAATRAYLVRLRANFGGPFMLMISSSHFGVKGFCYQVVATASLPYFKDYMGVSTEVYQAMTTVAWTPWSLKPLVGILSDVVPIRGYHKRWYMIGTTLVGSAALALLGVLPLSAGFAALGALLMFASMLQQAVVDLLVEGEYAKKMAAKPETGPDLVTWVWANYQSAQLLAACLVGTLADAFNPRVIFLVAVPFAAQILAPLFRGFLGEERRPPGDRGPRFNLVRQHKGVFSLALLMGLGALGLGVVNLLGTNFQRLAYSLASSAILNALAYWLMDVRMAKANTYLFLTQSTYLLIPGAIDYFYTALPAAGCAADAKCAASGCYVNDGPHFSSTYYLTVSQILASLAGYVGVTLFQTFLSTWYFRPVFWVTTLVRTAGAVFDVLIVARLNVAAGIPDKLAYLLGSTIIYNVVYMMDFMPAVVLTTRLCPKDLEAVIYALLAGFQNFGQQVSRTIGLVLISSRSYGVRTDMDGGECDFDNLPWLIAVCHMLVPLITIPLTFVLIPRARLDERLLADPAPKPSPASVLYEDESERLTGGTPTSDAGTEHSAGSGKRPESRLRAGSTGARRGAHDSS